MRHGRSGPLSEAPTSHGRQLQEVTAEHCAQASEETLALLCCLLYAHVGLVQLFWCHHGDFVQEEGGRAAPALSVLPENVARELARLLLQIFPGQLAESMQGVAAEQTRSRARYRACPGSFITDELNDFNSKVWQISIKEEMERVPDYIIVKSLWVMCNKDDS